MTTTPLDSISTVTPTGEWVVSLREALDAAVGTSLRYDGTIDGAWTFAVADLAGQVSEHLQLVIAASLLATAPPPVVVARARDQGLDVQPATYSTFTCTVAGTPSPVYVPLGTTLVPDAVAVVIGETGEAVQVNGSEWEVVENAAPSESVQDGDALVLRSRMAGQVILDADPIVFRPKNAIQGFDSAIWNSGDDRQVGQNAEPYWSLRQRIAARRAYRFGSPEGMVQTLRELPWVRAVGLTESLASIAVRVVPPPATSEQRRQLAAAIYATKPAGVQVIGAEYETVTGADGRPVVVWWTDGQEEVVTVAYTLTLVSGADATRAGLEARAALQQVFDALQPGDTLYYLRALSALNLPTVRSATLTLNGGTTDVSPSNAADVLVPGWA